MQTVTLEQKEAARAVDVAAADLARAMTQAAKTGLSVDVTFFTAQQIWSHDMYYPKVKCVIPETIVRADRRFAAPQY